MRRTSEIATSVFAIFLHFVANVSCGRTGPFAAAILASSFIVFVCNIKFARFEHRQSSPQTIKHPSRAARLGTPHSLFYTSKNFA